MGTSGSDNQSYRRGQALGFTVAELFTLLLFLVLLILAGVQQSYERSAQSTQRKLQQVQKDLEQARKSAAVLAEKDGRLRKYFGVPENFGDNFRDLVLSKGRMTQRQKEQSLIERAEAADEINGILKASGAAGQSNALRESEYDPKSLPAQVKACVDEKERLQGQVANVEKRYAGNGTVFPSCWVAGDGSTEFVFDIDLLSDPDGGRIVIHDHQVPGHEADKARLFGAVEFNQPVTDSDFLDDTQQFYEFGRRQKPECRFFVLVNDRTGPQDKSTFKNLLLTVEKIFYKELARAD